MPTKHAAREGPCPIQDVHGGAEARLASRIPQRDLDVPEVAEPHALALSVPDLLGHGERFGGHRRRAREAAELAEHVAEVAQPQALGAAVSYFAR